MINKLKPISIPIIVFIASLIIIYLLIPDYHPFGGLQVFNNRTSILNKSIGYLEQAGITYDRDKLKIDFNTNKNFVRLINSTYQLNKANLIIKKSSQAYYWTVTQSADSNDGITVSSSSEGNNNFDKTKFRLQILDDGNLIGFQETIKDSSNINKTAQIEHKITWETKANSNLNYKLTAQVEGGKVSSFNNQVILP